MVRFWIIGIVVGVAFTLYSLVDAAMSDGRRARGVAKPVWVVLIVLLPVIGGVLWFLIGRGRVDDRPQLAPDDDPRFSGSHLSQREVDRTLRDLEQQLRALDEETFPGETPRGPSEDSADGEQPNGETPPTADPDAPNGGRSGA